MAKFYVMTQLNKSTITCNKQLNYLLLLLIALVDNIKQNHRYNSQSLTHIHLVSLQLPEEFS